MNYELRTISDRDCPILLKCETIVRYGLRD